MLMSTILLLVAAPVTESAPTQKPAAVRVATASVTIIQAERVTPDRNAEAPRKRDRQVREREDKPMIEFY